MAKTHASRFAGLEERMVVTAAVDLEKEQAEQLAALFPGAVAALDYRTALDRVDGACALALWDGEEAVLACDLF